ncbi:hypothetical protein FIV42_18285 [Persicimonas caeni]|uniref:HEAT repeat domain-containing protein n=1 Tax=Persicimonas caeni TaxID=2292766 RepID=A0A4Y6PW97_PERCE|nr:hypothetical protein [Persicimonas caeni]QDG52614.1 hypothetical protein FIV42_18285 [Persicimonas caeni]QED33836.1 hypothetical protein FRD00_18280 [Persicimonas caeni]
MRKVVTILIALVAFVASTPAFAEYLPNGETQRDVVPSSDMLTKYLAGNGFVLSRLELREYSADPVEDLVEIATTSSEVQVVRSRAIQCLALYRSDDRARQAISDLMGQTRTKDPLFSVVLVSYAQVEGEQGAEKVAEYLDVKDADIRMAAVVSLGRFGGYAGYEALLERQKEEENARVLERISSYVQ